jgi:hypothetical protein
MGTKAGSIGTIFHKVIDGVHHLFVVGKQDVEQVKIFVDARPGLKEDLDKLLGPIKDAVASAFTTKFAELKASSPDQAPALFKAAIPELLNTVKESFVDQAKHAGNVDLMVSLGAQVGEALLGL